jgi:hypothetical protein
MKYKNPSDVFAALFQDKHQTTTTNSTSMDPVWENLPTDMLKIIATHSDIDTRRALGFGHLRVPLPVTDFALSTPRTRITSRDGSTLVNFTNGDVYCVFYSSRRRELRYTWRFGRMMYNFEDGKTSTYDCLVGLQ